MDKTLELLQEVAANPGIGISEWQKRTAAPVIGWLPIYVPLEVIHAAGALPVALWGGPDEPSAAAEHLQSFSCSIVRAATSYAQKGTYDLLDGVIFPSTCDHVQNTSDIWKKAFPSLNLFDLVYPVNRKNQGAASYLLAEYMALKDWLEGITGSEMEDAEVNRSIETYNRQRKLLDDLRKLKAVRPQALKETETAAIVKAGLFLPAEEYNQALTDLLPWLLNRTARPEPKFKVLLTGIMPEPWAVLEILEELGGAVVADDLALGARLSRTPVPKRPDPWAALINQHLNRDPCSTLFDPEKRRGRYLVKLARETGAQGVIFWNTKFCEAEEFDYPFLKEDLDTAGIPLLQLETEQQDTALGQVRTRLQTFAELL